MEQYEKAIRELNKRIEAYRYHNKPIYIDHVKIESFSARAAFISVLETERDVLITNMRKELGYD